MTLLEKLIAADNRPSGFDYLRLVLAVSVIAWHGVIVCYGRSAETPFWTGAFRPLPMIILPAFFALSGFLVGGSLERNSLPNFLALRVIRIFPALAVETFLCALILGPIFTALAWQQYFSDPLFGRYFFNLVGYVQFYLPGVFSGDKVNAQLWTVPYELECYIAIAVLAALRVVRYPLAFAAIVATLIISLTAIDIARGTLWPLDNVPPGRLLVLSFLCGVGLYLYRKSLPCNVWLGGAALLLSWITLSYSETVYLAAIPVAYLTVFLGLQDPARLLVIKGADYSYGMFLYGFPIQQAIVHIWPGQTWAFNVALSLIVAAAFAFLSWTYVEQPFMSKKAAILGFLNLRLKQLSPATSDRNKNG